MGHTAGGEQWTSEWNFICQPSLLSINCITTWAIPPHPWKIHLPQYQSLLLKRPGTTILTPQGKHIHIYTHMHPTPVLLPGKSHGWRSLVGCSPWGCEESDMTEWLHFHFPILCTIFSLILLTCVINVLYIITVYIKSRLSFKTNTFVCPLKLKTLENEKISLLYSYA